MYTAHSAKPAWALTTAEVCYWFERVQQIVTAFRQLRADTGVLPNTIVAGQLSVQTWLEADYLYRELETIERLGKVRLYGIQVRDPVPS